MRFVAVLCAVVAVISIGFAVAFTFHERALRRPWSSHRTRCG